MYLGAPVFWASFSCWRTWLVRIVNIRQALSSTVESSLSSWQSQLNPIVMAESHSVDVWMNGTTEFDHIPWRSSVSIAILPFLGSPQRSSAPKTDHWHPVECPVSLSFSSLKLSNQIWFLCKDGTSCPDQIENPRIQWVVFDSSPLRNRRDSRKYVCCDRECDLNYHDASTTA
jgi:hypothetical protein